MSGVTVSVEPQRPRRVKCWCHWCGKEWTALVGSDEDVSREVHAHLGECRQYREREAALCREAEEVLG